jgi:glycosyltransferase involved in cell wall biosynthesis
MNEKTPPAVSVVVPVRNEADNIAPLVAEIAAALAGRWPFEVVYVNDGSSDRTEAELLALMAERPWLRTLKHAESCGQSAAVRTGVAAARADVVATIDGDGQNDPVFLPPIIEALQNGAPRVGLVAGRRLRRRTTRLKQVQSRLANFVLRTILKTEARDTGCGLKAFRREMFLTLPYFDGLHRFLPPLAQREGFEIAYVDVIDRRRHAGRSNYRRWDRLWVTIADLAGVFWLIHRRKRIPAVSEVTPDACGTVSRPE